MQLCSYRYVCVSKNAHEDQMALFRYSRTTTCYFQPEEFQASNHVFIHIGIMLI